MIFILQNTILKNEKRYINRELSWLEFNKRVLQEAEDQNNDNPILERLKFLSIVSSNLDEFFMVRVASLYDQLDAGFIEPDPAGLTSREQIDLIIPKAQEMVQNQYRCLNRVLKKLSHEENISLLNIENVDESQKAYLQRLYINTIYPVLTPVVVDRSRPFPLVLNKSLNIALLLENDSIHSKDYIFGMVQVPSVLDRVIKVPSKDNKDTYMLLEDIIKMNIGTLFTDHKIHKMACYRVTRNTNQGLDEEEAEDLLEAIQEYIQKRKWGIVIRLEIESGMDPALLQILTSEFEISTENVYELKGPLDLTFLMKIASLPELDHLKYPYYQPQPVNEFTECDIFEAISKKDILLHHPFQSFDPIIDLVKTAANDPKVLAIKQTLYRVSGNSPIVEALAQAAENGKQVTVLVELKARFDEQNNIVWAKHLEMAGCQVIYGLLGLKTHCKILLIVRMENDGIKRYVHLSTGNYNDQTAKFYTDIGFLTSNPYFGSDASALFNMLSGYSRLTKMYKFEVAPFNLRSKFVSLIRQEAQNAKYGRKAHIIAKLNSLVDDKIIKELYDASIAGVKIELVVRGICCLKPGISGLSENITVKSIVGRYLEHSRIFYFHNDGEELIYISSADWMGRNLDRRVELIFPVEDKSLIKKLKDILSLYLQDNVKSRILNKDGNYTKVAIRNKKRVNSQETLCKRAIKEAQQVTNKKVLIDDLI